MDSKLIPLGVVWAGYLLIWYGYCTLKENGMGITDLIMPSHLAQAESNLGKGINQQAAAKLGGSGISLGNSPLGTPSADQAAVAAAAAKDVGRI